MTVELFGRPWCWRNKCIGRTQTVKPVQCVTALHCIPNNLNPDSLWTAEVISLLQYFKIQTKLTTGMSTLLLHASCLETFQLYSKRSSLFLHSYFPCYAIHQQNNIFSGGLPAVRLSKIYSIGIRTKDFLVGILQYFFTISACTCTYVVTKFLHDHFIKNLLDTPLLQVLQWDYRYYSL